MARPEKSINDGNDINQFVPIDSKPNHKYWKKARNISIGIVSVIALCLVYKTELKEMFSAQNGQITIKLVSVVFAIGIGISIFRNVITQNFGEHINKKKLLALLFKVMLLIYVFIMFWKI